MNKEENTIDSVHLEIPLLIRLFEYSREDATSDQDLHVVAENLLKCSQEMEGKPLSMACYDKVVPSKEDVKESTGDTLDKFEKNLYKAVEEANKGEWNLFKHAAQAASMMGKRMSKDINHKRFSNTVSLVDSASVQPDKGDAKYYIDLAKKQYVLFKSEYSKKESTVAGDIAQKDVSLFRGKDKMQRLKDPLKESVSLKESILRIISQG